MPNASTASLTVEGMNEFRALERLDFLSDRDVLDTHAQLARYAQLCGPVTVTYVKAA